MYTTYLPLWIPEGMKKYMKKPVNATTKNRAVRTRSTR
ncbi:hypothetical protein MmTuc01_1367 [Methanosarcina mazei Tuc01]|uniref:Uncharacterized protein n=1 Tax=Methanosarcina mazei Tuc01 TaxID=1236903 RepID=M1PWW7_METMZ|nr:hypothetical protein MmTuc01_1367 [Methanosarcina mazei Tuc01]